MSNKDEKNAEAIKAIFDRKIELISIVCLFVSLTTCWVADDHYDYKMAALQCSADE